MGKVNAGGVFIVRKDKKLLICHPTNHAPTFWSIPKGKIEAGETPLQGALRETYEETNIVLDEFDRNYSIHTLAPVNYTHKKKILHPFVYIENQESIVDWNNIEIKCNSNVPIERGGFPEMDDYKWVTIEESRNMLHQTQVECLDSVERLIELVDKTYSKLS